MIRHLQNPHIDPLSHEVKDTEKRHQGVGGERSGEEAQLCKNELHRQCGAGIQ